MWIKGEYLASWPAMRAAANGRLDRISQPGLFDRLDWFEALHRHCLADDPPLALRARSQGIEAWLILRQTGPGRFASLSNWYSFSYAPQLAGADSFAAALPQLGAIARRLRARAALVRLEPVPDDPGLIDALRQSFRSAGWRVDIRPTDINHYLDTGGRSFADYWSTRPGTLRSTVKRKGARFPLSITIHDRFDPALWAAFEEVYAASWKPAEGSPAFLRALAEQEGAAGTLRLGLARREGHPVAAQFWTTENGTARIHKLAHRSDADEGSPGTLLTHALFAHAFDVDRVARIDFGTGDDAYKRDWMEASRTLYRVDLLNLRKARAWGPALRSVARTLVRGA